MSRHAHYLAPNHKTTIPTRCIFFDTESIQLKHPDKNGIQHKLAFGWACYTRRHNETGWSKPEWYKFNTGFDFWAWVVEHVYNQTKTYIFCHNGSFDYIITQMLQNLPELGYRLNFAVIESPPLFFKYKSDKRTLICLDTLNFFRMPLRSIGKIIGLNKLQIPSDWNDEAIADAYCKRDVEIIYKAMLSWFDFIEEHDLGGFAPTLAGQSMRAYRHRFMTHPLKVSTYTDEVSLSRSCYYGGRTETYRIGGIYGDLYCVDVHSMYPSVMRNEMYPTQCIGYTKHCDLDKLKRWLKKYCVCAKVRLNTIKNAYPYKQNGKLIFPIGNFVTYLSTPELIYAIEQGDIVKIYEAAVYERANIFREFVDYFYNLRLKYKKEGQIEQQWRVKIILNSLYGKFGQKGIVYDTYEQTDDLSVKQYVIIHAPTGKRFKYRQFGGLVQVQKDEVESRESIPSIAAHVTAYARMKLYKAIQLAGPDNVYYCDTDSLYCNHIAIERLKDVIHPSKLGLWGVEKKARNMVIYGVKDYRFGKYEKHKGVKREAVWTSSNTIKQTQWSSFKATLKDPNFRYPETINIEKHLKRLYDKGNVIDGGLVIPYRL